MNDKIWLSPPHMGGAEMKFIEEAFFTNWIAPVGPNGDAFEAKVKHYVSRGHAAAVSSGTAALHLALLALQVTKGDIVICQSLTFAASANPIVYQGATPVFVDSEASTWNICPEALTKAILYYIKKGKKPKAVIGVHLYGMPAQLSEILTICDHYEIPFIEDAAEALGSEYNGQKIGSFGTMSIFSFNGNKIITTSAGGMLLSDDPELVSKAKFLASQSRDNAPYYQHSQIGFNYGLSNICAGIGLGQMEVIADRVAQRRANFEFYKNALENLIGLKFQEEPVNCLSNRWLTAFTLDSKRSGVSAESIRIQLADNNIESRRIWKPMHLQPVFSNAPYFGGRIAEELFQTGLCLPSGSSLSQDDLQRVTDIITKHFA
ncbi:DegT/DnrJ/EryC1/StrS aminotransferase family protein [Dyadobacter sp. CY326]|uniref:DegT/DnrJ/EryC1/StrS family aminotransferase n=1 Tax=Dyadobacter sp. CY326 TaxID=2907300 RepID=UPI001F2CF1AD|nr:aminotransferase class I/II-fold pyridoxal phosphate-dependent enzyme [Dyadobacter sp. CY326]MCE7067682.1 aminotransferase class I/II-fold pyridoxal phosphate-dependent enzyme [Dyadobacter sp. CY326]